MQTIGTPLQVEELHLSPERQGGINLSDDMQQTLSLVTAFCKNQRIVLKASPGGALRTTSMRIKDIVHFTADQADYVKTGDAIPCSECMCMAHPDNTGNVWVRSLAAATVNNAWPLAAGEVVNISIDNMRDLNMLIKVDTEKLIVAYA
ncbi:MAG: hypothetical protein GY782_01180 [Gammaproteobacteria bacterium]|nr:hypothetical protein [Gammaproteobacteria bacterium]